MYEEVGWPGELRPYQGECMERLSERWDAGHDRAWVVLPPGTGKTLVGLEAARRLGRRIVVFTPNTAIQSQWLAHWRECGGKGNASRKLTSRVTVLTYQSLAVFDPDAETDEEGHDKGLIQRLHSNGRGLIAALRGAGPLTLVLDECHHLLDVWGRLLAEVLDDLPDARVIGLTATPPDSLTSDEADLVDALFGTPIVGASVPAMVRQGYLAPFAELAWLTAPTPAETEYVAGEAQRFAELTTDLLAPGFASTPFLEWVDARLVELAERGTGGRLSWEWLERGEPEIAGAALRLHYAGLLALPPGARLREEHRHAPAAEDWVALLNDYVKNCLLPSQEAVDAKAVAAIRRALPAVGYQLTRRGIRSARSPVDRVLARSAAKTHAAAEIAATEAAALGDRLRCLVLCDHERATATLPSGLRDVIDPQAGAARLLLDNLIADDRTQPLRPMLVTGRTVAASEPTARAFTKFVAESSGGKGPELAVEPTGSGAAEITGKWRSRDWVPYVTAFFESGGCQVLVGTRGLLGEGWNAHGINALIDLTTATTPTSVVQTRGRALRLDPSWPEKTANTWTVVCVTDTHPKGAADWERFVRKHTGYLVAAPDGEVVSGVAHVDASFSPYAPPDTGTFDALNAQMIQRAQARDATRMVWRLGAEYRDELVHTIRVRSASAIAPAEPEAERPAEPPAVRPAPDCAAPLPPSPPPTPVPRLPAAPTGARSPDGRVRRPRWPGGKAPRPRGLLRRVRPFYLFVNAVLVLVYLIVGMDEGVWLNGLLSFLVAAFLPYLGLTFLEERYRSRRRERHWARTRDLMREYDDWLAEHKARLREYGAGDQEAFKAWLYPPLVKPLGRWRFNRYRVRARALMAEYEEWLAEQEARALEHCAQALDTVAVDPSVNWIACAVADALAACSLAKRGAEAVTVKPEPDGSYRLSLAAVDTATSERFAAALDELLSPMAMPRYAIPRYVVRPRTGDERLERAQAWRDGRARPDGVVYHSVPAILGQNRGRVKAFEKAWSTWVSHGSALFTSSPEGAGILATHRGEDPMSATTALRVAWD